jgi:hypothetical protein
MSEQYFFNFKSKISSHKYHAYLLGYDRVYTGLIPEDRLLLANYEEFTFPLTFKHNKKHKELDILDTGTGSLYLISDKLKSILECNNITGWGTFPIKLLDNKENEIYGYHGFSVSGRCGEINYNNSEIIYKPYFEGGPICKYYKGWQFDLNKWDGSDLFIPKHVLTIIATNKIENIIKTNKITNFRLIKLMDDEVSEDIVQMDEKRKNENRLF